MEVEAYCVGMLVLITAVVIVQNSVYLSVIIFVVHIPDVILVGVLFHLKLIHFKAIPHRKVGAILPEVI